MNSAANAAPRTTTFNGQTFEVPAALIARKGWEAARIIVCKPAIAAWSKRQVDYCLAAGSVRSDGRLSIQECIGARRGYPAGYFCAEQVIDSENDDLALRERFGADVSIEWRGSFFSVYSATKLDR